MFRTYVYFSLAAAHFALSTICWWFDKAEADSQLHFEELAARDAEEDETTVHDWARAAFALVMSNHLDAQGCLWLLNCCDS